MLKILIAFAVLGSWALTGLAQAESPPDPADARKAEARAAWEAAIAAMKSGPASIPLAGQATFHVPDKTGFVPLPEATRLAMAVGDISGPDFVGTVVGQGDWVAYLSYIPAGHVEDGDAKEWQADELLASLRSGTERDNQDRAARGFAPLEITGWIEPPRYDPVSHRLVWSVGVRELGQAKDAELAVNYNTFVLGREGYISLNFVTGSNIIEAEKPIANDLLAAIAFDDEKRYDDFNASTDNVAAFGLAALIGGVALKKVGFFAIAAAFLAKFAKAGILLVFGLFAALSRLFRRKKAGGES